MKDEKLFEAFADIDENYVIEAEIKKKKAFPVWAKWTAVAACLMLVACAVTLPRLLRTRSQNIGNGTETESAAPQTVTEEKTVASAEPAEKVPAVDDALNAAFGNLFPSQIAEGYVLDENGIEIYNGTVLQASYYNRELDDTLLIRVAPDGYFGNVEYGAVQYGDAKADGTRSSRVYYENDGSTVMYQYGKTDAAGGECYLMAHSAKCFDAPASKLYDVLTECRLSATMIDNQMFIAPYEEPQMTPENLLARIRANLTVFGTVTGLESARIEKDGEVWFLTTAEISVEEVLNGSTDAETVRIVAGACFENFSAGDEQSVPARGLENCAEGTKAVFILHEVEDEPWTVCGEEVFPKDLGDFYIVSRLDREGSTLTYRGQNITVEWPNPAGDTADKP